MRIRLHDEAGTAAVELAILAPLLVAILSMSIFVGDLAVARIGQRQAVRLLAWEFTGGPLSDERSLRHRARWEEAASRARGETDRRFAGEAGLANGLLARGRLGEVQVRPLSMPGDETLRRPAVPAGFGDLLEGLGSLLQRASGAQQPLLQQFGFNLDHVGVVAEADLEVQGTGLLPDLPRRLSASPARLELQVDTWAVDDGADVPLPGTETPLGRQVARIALFGVGERLRRLQGGEAAAWIPFVPGAPVVSMNYGDADPSPVGCGGDDPLARSGRWANGPAAGTPADTISPVRCFDTLPIDANGFGPGGGRRSDPLWLQLEGRGPYQLGCDVPYAAFPDGCGERGGGRWADAARR